MKTSLYLITYKTNYGLSSVIVEAVDEKKAKEMVDGWVWEGYDINEIVKTGENKILFEEYS